MAEAEIDTPAKTDSDEAEVKAPKSARERIETNLKRGAKLASAEAGGNDDRVHVMMKEAEILALLEVAAALNGADIVDNAA